MPDERDHLRQQRIHFRIFIPSRSFGIGASNGTRAAPSTRRKCRQSSNKEYDPRQQQQQQQQQQQRLSGGSSGTDNRVITYRVVISQPLGLGCVCIYWRVLYVAVFPIRSLRFTIGFLPLTNRTAPHRRFYGIGKPRRTVPQDTKVAPNRTVGCATSENRTGPNRAVGFTLSENCTEPHRRLFQFLKTAPNRTVGMPSKPHGTAPFASRYGSKNRQIGYLTVRLTWNRKYCRQTAVLSAVEPCYRVTVLVRFMTVSARCGATKKVFPPTWLNVLRRH